MIKFKLREILAKESMSLNQFAKLAGIRYEAIWNMCNYEELAAQGKPVKLISVKVLDQICETLDCSLEDVVEYIPNKK
ncbi:transcriptional regulator [Priestia megaterium]|uniref:helix-turn-helix domain-containing protein n=1 Tax=Priestia TaxID=2800373 RepID=UPI000BED3E5B|nr:helix-turn-helix transcriptional regulator [Priestia megaterium]MED3972276.1 helix-turn-helix transcriptional regulator [Priestia megaterium]PEB63294.1 transcriptional regulator [Priestia megaterium]